MLVELVEEEVPRLPEVAEEEALRDELAEVVDSVRLVVRAVPEVLTRLVVVVVLLVCERLPLVVVLVPRLTDGVLVAAGSVRLVEEGTLVCVREPPLTLEDVCVLLDEPVVLLDGVREPVVLEPVVVVVVAG